MDYQVNQNGTLRTLQLENGFSVPFRNDDYAGPAFREVSAGKERIIPLCPKGESYYGERFGVSFTLSYARTDDAFQITATIQNNSDGIYAPESAGLKLGIDCNMESYPQWDSSYFPTLLRCEKTHFWGYMMSPAGGIITLCSPDAIASWDIDFTHSVYGVERHPGHRLYTVNLNFLNEGPLPDRHPEGLSTLAPGETKTVTLFISTAKEESFAAKQTAARINAPYITASRYTYAKGEPVVFESNGEVALFDETGEKLPLIKDGLSYKIEKNLLAGVYKALSQSHGKISEARIYVRNPWSYYLNMARQAAWDNPQKPASHSECWYGFFSAFTARKHLPNSALDQNLLDHFNKVLRSMYDIEKGIPHDDTMPGRIQNTSSMVSLLVDVYEATDDIWYLRLASKMADWLITFQATDGSYRCGWGEFYTCVIYPAKSVLELYLVEKELPEELWQERAKKHYHSAKLAIENLTELRDNIGTEGELTFEDSMITCSALQMGMIALMDGELKEKCTEAAEYMMKKHRCLEQLAVPDCRMRGATYRYWESKYDILTNRNMLNSPHGWTSWKTYATYYLYLLTHDITYLHMTMETVGTCMQMVEHQTGKLRWAFITDPFIKTELWKERENTKGMGQLYPETIGEQYIDMISGWWRADDNVNVWGYAYTDGGAVDGVYKGGCCDNDVHEHFKCLEEVCLTNCFVHETADGFECYNCRAEQKDGGLVITPHENLVCNLYVFLLNPAKVIIEKETHQLADGFHHLPI